MATNAKQKLRESASNSSLGTCNIAQCKLLYRKEGGFEQKGKANKKTKVLPEGLYV